MLAEDSTAVLGVLLAMVGLVLHRVTGDGRWEGVASLCIGVLLVYVAFTLGRDAAANSSARPPIRCCAATCGPTSTNSRRSTPSPPC